jgi:hypothetical protein
VARMRADFVRARAALDAGRGQKLDSTPPAEGR